MIHDEPSHRPGQDPYAYAPETEGHYGERIMAYQDLLAKCRASGSAPDTTMCHLERELEKYQGWLDSLIARKRHEGRQIRYEYAQPDDTVFIEGECPFTGGGIRYTKQQMLDVCMGDDIAAKRLTTACLERGAKRFDKVSEDGYESFAYNASLPDLRQAYKSETVYNLVVLVHDDFRLTEIVFDKGLDGLYVGQALDLNDKLHDLAAKHLKLCLINVEEGLSSEQDAARDSIESQVREICSGIKGIKDAKFIYDPRGTTVAVVFESGAYNSFSGGWKVPVDPEYLKSLDVDAFTSEYAQAKP